MQQSMDLIELLKFINPASLDYQEWVNIGMALKHEGYSVSIWDSWSTSDRRYKQGECARKWNSFSGSCSPVTAGTIVQLAKDNGWKPDHGHELDWDDVIVKDDLVIVDKNWLESREITEPANWEPEKELILYLETLFDSTDNVGYVTRSWEKDGKYLPTQGAWDRSAGKLIQELNKCNGDICNVIGDYSKEAGAWIRFNPLDGKGCKNDNVTEFRFALVESDAMELDQQNALIRELELPVACMVYSGGKSLHAIVRVDATDYKEYQTRVNYLYKICSKNGLVIDTQNRNPSRLSRMPGIIRNDKKQFIVDTNIGKSSFDEWKDWIESVNDDLPDPENLFDEWEHLPDLADPLIEGVLRQGHKMLIAGPSKAGKSFALIEMCCAIAEGRQWLGFQCTRGKVMYVNLELDRASCLHRFKDVYGSLGWQPNNLQNIDIWNLRGKSIPMDKLAPKLIRRAVKKDYIAIIIDPIYKVITGDENSADQMANFCNQFDKVCTELGCAVIYCHHHSKGTQGNKKSMDRASGSGVFARDPDALLDLIELELPDTVYSHQEDKAACDVCMDFLNDLYPDWEDDLSQDDMCSPVQMLAYCKKKLSLSQYNELNARLMSSASSVKKMSAWRIEGTLREFPKFDPVNAWFDYPVHKVDKIGILNDVKAETETGGWKRNLGRKKSKEDLKQERNTALENAFQASKLNGEVTVKDLSDYLGITEKTVRNRIKEHGGFWIDEGKVGEKGS